jgi:hypothetical protein
LGRISSFSLVHDHQPGGILGGERQCLGFPDIKAEHGETRSRIAERYDSNPGPRGQGELPLVPGESHELVLYRGCNPDLLGQVAEKV